MHIYIAVIRKRCTLVFSLFSHKQEYIRSLSSSSPSLFLSSFIHGFFHIITWYQSAGFTVIHEFADCSEFYNKRPLYCSSANTVLQKSVRHLKFEVPGYYLSKHPGTSLSYSLKFGYCFITSWLFCWSSWSICEIEYDCG